VTPDPDASEQHQEGEPPSAQQAITIPDDILATAAHELRTPINAILGYTEILARELVGPLTLAQQEHLGHIAMSARHLLMVANRVLDLAKAEAGAAAEALTVRQRRSSAASAVSAALTLVHPQAAERGVHLSSGVDHELDVWYYGDPDLVKQILINLLSNAVKFTQADGRVVVFAGEANETNHHGVFVRRRTYLRVDDTGIGIAPDQLEAMFDPFVQGPTATGSGSDAASRGTGLGLTISRRLARLMGGEVTVTSTPNVGSQFTLWLPADETLLIRM
jgi:signal transduction histidine kinase